MIRALSIPMLILITAAASTCAVDQFQKLEDPGMFVNTAPQRTAEWFHFQHEIVATLDLFIAEHRETIRTLEGLQDKDAQELRATSRSMISDFQDQRRRHITLYNHEARHMPASFFSADRMLPIAVR